MAIIVGVDAGQHNGLAAWCNQRRAFIEVKTYPIIDLLFILERYTATPGFKEVVIEDPSVNKPLFVERYTKEEIRVKLKIAQDVGANKRTAEIVILWCIARGIKHRLYKPVASASKWTPAGLRQFTGYDKPTNEHERDAMRMVYGL